jgi:polysaccharide pyruvyl transferase WcaK-like protein
LEEERTMIKVVIPEPIPSLNKGEAAILEGILQMLSLGGQYEVTLFSPDSWIRDDSRNYGHLAKLVGGANLLGGTKRGRLLSYVAVCRWLVLATLSRLLGRFAKGMVRDELFKSMCDADVILAAHDGMMGPGQSHVARVGRIMNKPVVFCGSGMGTVADLSPRQRRQVQYAVNHSRACVVRDKGTYDDLRSCQVDEDRIRLSPDPAVLLPPRDDARVAEILEAQGIPEAARGNMCAVVVAEGGIVARESFAAEKDLIAKRRLRVRLWQELLSHLIDTTNAYVVFLPHCIGFSPGNDDRRIARDIGDALPYKEERVKCMMDEYSAGELKGIMKHCQLVLSERAHAAIGAFSAGTPCVGFAPRIDHRMFRLLTGMFNRPVHDLEAPDTSQLKMLVTAEWNNRQQTAAAMAEHVEKTIEEARAAARWMNGRIEGALCRRP